ncbi:hypothetical protein Hamer_G003313 [Homarus americanus]|uniref:Secreted protein n=1 Tax=Homarus americanus TaxID=6706 RepID=A0A8J5T9T4_HOMAM|nr:hypothetical protein Hamer_G003313 [Homarus americanus]
MISMMMIMILMMMMKMMMRNSQTMILMMVMTAEMVNRDRLVLEHIGGWSSCWPECLNVPRVIEKSARHSTCSQCNERSSMKYGFSRTCQLLSSNLRIRANIEVKSEVAPPSSPSHITHCYHYHIGPMHLMNPCITLVCDSNARM